MGFRRRRHDGLVVQSVRGNGESAGCSEGTERRRSRWLIKPEDSNALGETITSMEAEAVIPSNRSRKIIPHDEAAYKDRNRIELCFTV
jgi:hypothetical protein